MLRKVFCQWTEWGVHSEWEFYQPNFWLEILGIPTPLRALDWQVRCYILE